MYPRNSATPPRIEVGAVVLIADGTVQTSGVAITVRLEGGAESPGGGTIAYGASGVVYYTPTQAETNGPVFIVIASKAACLPSSRTIVTFDAAAVRAALGLAAANVDTQLGTITAKTNNIVEKGVRYRYTNNLSGSGFDEVTVGDPV